MFLFVSVYSCDPAPCLLLSSSIPTLKKKKRARVFCIMSRFVFFFPLQISDTLGDLLHRRRGRRISGLHLRSSLLLPPRERVGPRPDPLPHPAQLQRPRLLAQRTRGAPQPGAEVGDRGPSDRKPLPHLHPAPGAEPDPGRSRHRRQDRQNLPRGAVLVRAVLNASGERLCQSGARCGVFELFGRGRARREAAELLDVVNSESDQPEERGEREEEEGPGDGA